MMKCPIELLVCAQIATQFNSGEKWFWNGQQIQIENEMKDVNQLLVVRIESHNVFYSLPYKIVLSFGEINVKYFLKLPLTFRVMALGILVSNLTLTGNNDLWFVLRDEHSRQLLLKICTKSIKFLIAKHGAPFSNGVVCNLHKKNKEFMNHRQGLPERYFIGIFLE